MPDEDHNFGGSLVLHFRNDDVTCNPRIDRLKFYPDSIASRYTFKLSVFAQPYWIGKGREA